MSGNTLAIATPSVPPLVFQPPAGGDLTLQSCDGTTFKVHSVLLGLSSQVFSDMLTTATKSDTVKLAEDAETISLMLAFIYPIDPPSITTVDQLEKLMAFSQKYDIEKIVKYIENYDRWDSLVILSDPVRVFRASVKHNFPTIRMLSAKGFGLKRYDYRSPKGLEEFARLFPESSWAIGLIGAQLVRDEIFKDLYTRVEVKPKFQSFSSSYLSSSDAHTAYMVCKSCWSKRSNNNSVYTPGWLPYWMKQLHKRHISDPLDSCEDLLSVASIIDAEGCSACITQTLTKRGLFEDWARKTKKIVDKELVVLEKLYSL